MDLYKGVPHNSVHYRKKLESTKLSTIENRELKCHRCYTMEYNGIDRNPDRSLKHNET